jgi:predicted CoA-substrate-specific enzyme activase
VREIARLGIDIGSTTIKYVVTDSTFKALLSGYERHNTKVTDTLVDLLMEINQHFPDTLFHVAFTGSAGMGIAEATEMQFTQEVIAASRWGEKLYPNLRSIFDIGGEDAKLVLIDEQKRLDIRMNGNCAGGTGAYIDQMATLMNASIEQLNQWAFEHQQLYPIASRCGVFAKTDLQNLISRNISKPDISASIFEAIAQQTLNSLGRGAQIETPILLTGGPFTFIPFLRHSFAKALDCSLEDLIIPERGDTFTAHGTAYMIDPGAEAIPITALIERVAMISPPPDFNSQIKPLFNSNEEYQNWKEERKKFELKKGEFKNSEQLFLGIDSGSTTSKIVLLNENSEIVFHSYKPNNGDPLKTILVELEKLKNQLDKSNRTLKINCSAVTGYGEEWIQKGLGIDLGLVETVAHLKAAQYLDPEVTFVLDIGGQDMKAMTVQDGKIINIAVNEACSSGCGTFIEGFAQTLGYPVEEFALLGTQSQRPYDLGSRCTVFMNSKVKQALREGATVGDLSAGLAYSVIKNCLYKVLHLQSVEELGDHIVVQGGTFKNDAVSRSLELLTDQEITSSNMPELMGAYGAALHAFQYFQDHPEYQSGFDLETTITQPKPKIKLFTCHGCTNQCVITQYYFENGNQCYTGNKCEKIFTNNPAAKAKGENIFDIQYQYLMDRIKPKKSSKDAKKIKIGLPLILNMYENYPFWHTLFTVAGLEVVTSDESTQELYKKGTGAIMADNICFPAKLSHGHLVNLVEKGVDRIFIPMVIYENKQFDESTNSFNCPIVSGYPEVLQGSIKKGGNDSTPSIDNIPFNMDSEKLLYKACRRYLKQLGISKSETQKAFQRAIEEQKRYNHNVAKANKKIVERANKAGKPIIMVAGHPYHIDPLIHQKVSHILTDLGVYVINEQITKESPGVDFSRYYTISQWEYPNRILQAMEWVSKQPFEVGFVQLNSFGCGLDTIIMNELKLFAASRRISYAWIRIDEIATPGSIKLRLRSFVESITLKRKQQQTTVQKKVKPTKQRALFEKKDRERTILFPWFSEFYSSFAPTIAKQVGYRFENLPPSDQESIQTGLKYAHNEVCYPATLVVGDIIKALQSGKYDRDKIAIGITQTGGQCRATNYLSLIKRAMDQIGFHDVPLIGLGMPDGTFNEQPGFDVPWLKILKPTFITLLFADALSEIYYATVSKEEDGTQSKALKDKYIKLGIELLEKKESNKLFKLLEDAIAEFNQVPIAYPNPKTVGIVGEIYLKYNSFAQYYIIDWLIENHIEVRIPPMLEFMIQAFVNGEVQRKEFIAEKKGLYWGEAIAELLSNHYIEKMEKVKKQFRYYTPGDSIREAAAMGEEILNLNHQFGEGWLIPSEIVGFIKKGVNDVICLQPFGCIANHVIGKGMEHKIKQRYPQANLLYLDFDSGVSKVNILNRLHFLIQN